MNELLYISHCVPYPPDKGERIRAFHEIRALSEHFHITLACLDRTDGGKVPEQLPALCRAVHIGRIGRFGGLLRGGLASLTGRSVTEGFYTSGALRRQLRELLRRQRFDIVFGYSSAVLPYVDMVPADVRVVDLVDIDSLKWAGYAQRSGGLKRWAFAREARAVARLERSAITSADATICVSAAEAAVAPKQSPKLHAFSNGVDSEYFFPTCTASQTPPELVFVGTMDYPPNVEAVCWFCREVWSTLRRRLPEAQLRIVGRNPPRSVVMLAEMAGVTVSGSVPDVRPHLTGARAVIAPLLMARGIQNKVLEGMAMARPVIASTPALEGLEVSETCGVLRADSPAQWLGHAESLLTEPARAAVLGQAARDCVTRQYGWSACLRGLVDLCRRLVDAANTCVAKASTP